MAVFLSVAVSVWWRHGWYAGNGPRVKIWISVGPHTYLPLVALRRGNWMETTAIFTLESWTKFWPLWNRVKVNKWSWKSLGTHWKLSFEEDISPRIDLRTCFQLILTFMAHFLSKFIKKTHHCNSRFPAKRRSFTQGNHFSFSDHLLLSAILYSLVGHVGIHVIYGPFLSFLSLICANP